MWIAWLYVMYVYLITAVWVRIRTHSHVHKFAWVLIWNAYQNHTANLWSCFGQTHMHSHHTNVCLYVFSYVNMYILCTRNVLNFAYSISLHMRAFIILHTYIFPSYTYYHCAYSRVKNFIFCRLASSLKFNTLLYLYLISHFLEGTLCNLLHFLSCFYCIYAPPTRSLLFMWIVVIKHFRDDAFNIFLCYIEAYQNKTFT